MTTATQVFEKKKTNSIKDKDIMLMLMLIELFAFSFMCR